MQLEVSFLCQHAVSFPCLQVRYLCIANLSRTLKIYVLIVIGVVFRSLFSLSFTALAVLLDFLLQVTAFVALIVFDFLRTEDNRVDCFPCVKRSGYAGSDKGRTLGTLILFIIISLYKFIALYCGDALSC